MIDRAMCAGMLVGTGLLLIGQQVTAETPKPALVLGAVVLAVLGAVWWSDLREERDDATEVRRGRR